MELKDDMSEFIKRHSHSVWPSAPIERESLVCLENLVWLPCVWHMIKSYSVFFPVLLSYSPLFCLHVSYFRKPSVQLGFSSMFRPHVCCGFGPPNCMRICKSSHKMLRNPVPSWFWHGCWCLMAGQGDRGETLGFQGKEMRKLQEGR